MPDPLQEVENDREVRHYIAATAVGRMHMQMTASGRSRVFDDSRRHPWEPIVGENGVAWYRVSGAVAREFDADDPDDVAELSGLGSDDG